MLTRSKSLMFLLLVVFACDEPTRPPYPGHFGSLVRADAVKDVLAVIPAAVTVRGSAEIEDDAIVDGKTRCRPVGHVRAASLTIGPASSSRIDRSWK